MKYLFFGTPEFAAIILEKLIKAGYIPEAVVCNPDRPVGRKKIITPPPVKERILNLKSEIKNKIKIFQPEKLTHIDIACDRTDCLYYKNCDIFIVAAYAKIIPKEILEIPRLGTIGIHPSLLPKYRGSSPIQTAILNGDKITGVTLYLMDEKMDHGPILAQQELEIPNSKSQIPNKIQNSKFKITYEELLKKLAELGADLLIELLRKLNQFLEVQPPRELNSLIFERLNLLQSQDESLATYTKKFTTGDAFVEPKDLEKAQKQGGEIAVQIERKLRALNPEPGVFTITDNKRIKLLEAELTADKKLQLKKIQPEGKKPIIITALRK